MNRQLPVEYHLEIYEKSFVNDPTASFTASSAFMTFQIGSYIDPVGFEGVHTEVPPRHWWKIVDVVHRVWEIKDNHVAHQVGVCVEVAPRPGG